MMEFKLAKTTGEKIADIEQGVLSNGKHISEILDHILDIKQRIAALEEKGE